MLELILMETVNDDYPFSKYRPAMREKSEGRRRIWRRKRTSERSDWWRGKHRTNGLTPGREARSLVLWKMRLMGKLDGPTKGFPFLSALSFIHLLVGSTILFMIMYATALLSLFFFNFFGWLIILNHNESFRQAIITIFNFF